MKQVFVRTSLVLTLLVLLVQPAWAQTVTRITGNMYLITLLSAQTSSDNGNWVDVSRFKVFSVHVDSNVSGSDVIQVRASNVPDKPSDATHASQLGSDITTADFIQSSSDNRFMWIKARKSVGGGSATNVYLFGERE